MPRRGRLTLPGVPLHLIQQGNNRQAIFFEEADYRHFFELLHGGARRTDAQVHAFVLMTNHFHLLVTTATPDGAGKLMKLVGQSYVQFVNRKYGRTGSLWEARFRSCLVQEESNLHACQRYIELNPVRAQMVLHPAAYPWSSYRANALGEVDELIEPHMVYEGLGLSLKERCTAYQELFSADLDPELVSRIRCATNGNFALGNEAFAKEISATLGRRADRGKPGPPRKPTEPGNQPKPPIG